jgi:hypothetical protein
MVSYDRAAVGLLLQLLHFRYSATHSTAIFVGAALLYLVRFGLMCLNVKEGRAFNAINLRPSEAGAQTERSSGLSVSPRHGARYGEARKTRPPARMVMSYVTFKPEATDGQYRFVSAADQGQPP